MVRRFSVVWLVGLALASIAVTATAQQVAMAAHGPRFLAAAGGGELTADADEFAILRRRVTLTLDGVPLDRALKAITDQAGLQITYSKATIPVDRPVSLHARNLTVAAVLTELLLGLGVDVSVTRSGHLALVRRAGIRQATGGLVGRITDSSSKLGVVNAEVFLNGTAWKTTTDTAGRYRLVDVDSGAYKLTVRRLGYGKETRTVTVQDNQIDTVDVVLAPVAARLQELVSTATGPRRRLDVANDITTINADSVMQAAPIRSVTDLLENRVPGLTVQHTSGAPGDPSRLRLRGLSSPLKNNDPIVIVDGVRVYAEQSSARGANLADTKPLGRIPYAAPSPLDYIDPNTIEKIEVLKGPSAATLYGQDAANGVILITTKKGRPGPFRWTASAEQGRTNMEGQYPDLLYSWGHDIYNHWPNNCPIAGVVGTTPCVVDSVLSFQLLNDPALTVLDHGHRTALSLGGSGGTSALTYSLTGSYSDETGLIRLPDYETNAFQSAFGVAPPDWMRRPQRFKQWGVTSGIQAQLGAKASVRLTAGLSRSEQQRSSLEQQLGELMTTYLDRSSGIYYQGGTDGYAAVTDNVLGNYHLQVLDGATSFTNSANFEYRPQSWLTVTADAGLNVVQRSDRLYFPRGPQGSGGVTDTLGAVTDAEGRSTVSTINLRANARRSLGRGFQFTFAAGANYTGTSTSDLSAASRGLAPGASLVGSTASGPPTHNETSDATFGWYAEPSVGNSKFNFSSGLRLDGGKTYGGNVSGLSLPKFPKLGFSYLVSDEPWFPLKDLVQSLRVRLSYGRASRQPGPTDRFRLYNTASLIPGDSQVVAGVTLASLGNTEVRPERSSEFEGGLDADLFDSRLTLSLTGFRKTTDDALLNVPVAPEILGGGVQIVKNIGVTRATGLEMTVGGALIRNGPVTWQTNLQLSRRREMVVKLAPGVEPFYTDVTLSSEGIGGNRIAPGYPVDGRWSRPILGFADANGDGVLSPSEIQIGDTAVYVGSVLPNYTLSLSTTISLWRGALTVDGLLDYQDGLSQRNTTALALAPFTAGAQIPGTSVAEQEATIDLTSSEVPSNKKTDFNWIQTVSTTRFGSLSVRYRVPTVVAHRFGAQTLDLSVQGSNLGLWTNYRGLDPNVNAYSTGNSVVDNGVLPLPRTWQVRVNATF